MGQYFQIANLDKKQYINPHECGDGFKLGEIAGNSCGSMTLLTYLLADNCDRFRDDTILGTWSGDRIVVTGDYGSGLYDELEENFQNITQEALFALVQDSYYARILKNKTNSAGTKDQSVYDFAMEWKPKG